MRLRLGLSAGLLDAALASLASLGTAIYAARTLPLDDLGTYALFFSAFVFAAVVPAQLVLVPAAYEAVFSAQGVQRLGFLSHTVRLAALPAVTATTVGCLAASLAASASTSIVIAFATTTALCSIASPIQDHVRRVLHMAGLSWAAALVSGVQLMTVAVSLVALGVSGVSPVWCPFTALAIANIVSSLAGVALARSKAGPFELPRPRRRDLIRSGRWLLGFQVAGTGALLISSALVTQLAGAEVLGQAESARVVAQPVIVLTMALTSVYWPALADAGRHRDAAAGRRLSRPFLGALVVGGLAYGAATAVPWSLNPLDELLPQAYQTVGLVPLTVLGNLLVGLFAPIQSELVGAARERTLALVGTVGGVLQCMISLTAPWLEALARPAGSVSCGAVFCMARSPLHRVIYQSRNPIPVHSPQGTAARAQMGTQPGTAAAITCP